jgi:hypothetical protein
MHAGNDHTYVLTKHDKDEYNSHCRHLKRLSHSLNQSNKGLNNLFMTYQKEKDVSSDISSLIFKSNECIERIKDEIKYCNDLVTGASNSY